MTANNRVQVSSGSDFLDVATKLRAVAVAVFAGALSGAVACGIGARLAMRVTALLASDSDQGTLTDAQATVGDVSVAGTIFLVVLGAAVGSVGGLLYMAAHRRLAWAGPWRGLVFGALILAIFGSTLIEGRNPDFDRFGIPIVNVAMFATLFVFFGVLIAPVYDNVQRAVPSPSTSALGLILLSCEVFGVVVLVPATMLVFALLVADAALASLAIAAMIGYLLVAMPLRFPMRSAAASFTAEDFGPLALPIAAGLALDVSELFAIF